MLQAIAVIRTAERKTDGIRYDSWGKPADAGTSAHCRGPEAARQWPVFIPQQGSPPAMHALATMEGGERECSAA
jgi:hypothetical protein